MWLRALFAGACLSSLLGACALVDPVDSRYDTITRSLAKARNEAIFLNLIRASYDYPLSFNTIANVTPTMTNTSSFALPTFSSGPPNCILAAIPGTTRTCSFPMGAPGASTIFGSTTASNSTAVSTNFNVSTEETGSFYEGFLKPIDLTILDYFIRQGYPRELLFWLFTDSFELTLPGTRPLGFRYNPPHDLGCDSEDKKRRCFTDWVHTATFSGLTVEEKTQERASAGAGAGGAGAGGSSGPTAKPTTYTYARFCFNYVLAKQAAALAPLLAKQAALDEDVSQNDLFNSGLQCGSSSWHPENDALKPQEDILPLRFNNNITFRIVPRSAYGVFQFLGMLIRLQRENYQPPPYPPDTPPDPEHYPSRRSWVGDMPPVLETVYPLSNPDDKAKLIQFIAGDAGAQCFVYTWLDDANYCIPNEAQTTKLIFAILAQLIAIQTTAADLSITPIVRVIQ